MSSNLDWNDTIKKEARGIGNDDFGEVQEVSDRYVFTQKGVVDKMVFRLPKDKAISFDGKILRFDITEKEAMEKYVNSVGSFGLDDFEKP